MSMQSAGWVGDGRGGISRVTSLDWPAPGVMVATAYAVGYGGGGDGLSAITALPCADDSHTVLELHWLELISGGLLSPGTVFELLPAGAGRQQRGGCGGGRRRAGNTAADFGWRQQP